MESRFEVGCRPSRSGIVDHWQSNIGSEDTVCGICGKLSFDRGATVSPVLLKAMAEAIHHRGPDDDGYYVSGAVGLGFRRLSIIDLSGGHQPLSNEDGTVWIV